MNVRYLYLGKGINQRLLKPGHHRERMGVYKAWLGNKKSTYSLKKDLKIIQAYIRVKGGLLINENRFGKIYSIALR
jgi:hypothetical protein